MLNSVVWAIWAVLALTGESRVEVVDFQDASELRRRLSSPKLKQSFGSITASTQDSILVTVVRIFVVEIDTAYIPEELAPDVVWQPFSGESTFFELIDYFEVRRIEERTVGQETKQWQTIECTGTYGLLGVPTSSTGAGEVVTDPQWNEAINPSPGKDLYLQHTFVVVAKNVEAMVKLSTQSPWIKVNSDRLQITYSLPASAEVLSGHIVAQAYVWGSHVVASNYTQTAWDQSGDFSRGMVLAEASSQVASNEFTMELNISPTPELGLVHAAGVMLVSSDPCRPRACGQGIDQFGVCQAKTGVCECIDDLYFGDSCEFSPDLTRIQDADIVSSFTECMTPSGAKTFSFEREPLPISTRQSFVVFVFQGDLDEAPKLNNIAMVEISNLSSITLFYGDLPAEAQTVDITIKNSAQEACVSGRVMTGFDFSTGRVLENETPGTAGLAVGYAYVSGNDITFQVQPTIASPKDWRQATTETGTKQPNGEMSFLAVGSTRVEAGGRVPVADWFKASDTATTVQGFLVFTDQACPSATITPSSPAVLVDNLTKLEDLEDIEFEFSGVATSDLILTYRCREAFVLSKTVEVISVEGAPLSFTPPAWLITSIKSVSPTRVSITLAVDDKLTSATNNRAACNLYISGGDCSPTVETFVSIGVKKLLDINEIEPTILGIEGCAQNSGEAGFFNTSIPLLNSGVELYMGNTSDCPTAGSTMLTIWGLGFDGNTVFEVGSGICSEGTVYPFDEGSVVVCTLPEGAGIVETAALYQNGSEIVKVTSDVKLGYAPPQVSNVTVKGSGTCKQIAKSLSECSRVEQQQVTLSGQNLGAQGALVLFGGSVVRTEHDKTAPHARVFFNIPLDVTLPKVVGYCACTSSLAIIVLQADQLSGNTEVFVEFEQCEKGEYLDEGSGECKRCEAGKYSPGGVTTCELCSRYGDKYAALDEDGDVVCNDCPASGGAECVAGQLTAKAGFWVSKDENGVFLNLLACDSDVCLGPSEADGTETCGVGRKPDVRTNVLCGTCLDGHSMWGGKCADCTQGADSGWVLLMILMSWMFIIGLYKVSQSTRGEVKIFFYFVQMATLAYTAAEVRGISSWLAIFSLTATDTLFGVSNPVCFADASMETSALIGLVAPWICIFFLGLTFSIHLGLYVLFHGKKGERNTDRPWFGPLSLHSNKIRFKVSPYLRTVLAVLLFSYNTMTKTALEFLACIDVDNDSSTEGPGVGRVNRFYPAIRCDTSSFASLTILIYIVVVIVVVGLPLAILIKLISVQKKHPGKLWSLKEPKFHERYGYLYETFKRSRYWWEGVILARRSLIIVLSIPDTDRTTRLVRITSANLAVLVMHLILRPFERDVYNDLETGSLISLVAISLILSNVELPLNAGFSFLLTLLIVGPMFLLIAFSCRDRLRQRKETAESKHAPKGQLEMSTEAVAL